MTGKRLFFKGCGLGCAALVLLLVAGGIWMYSAVTGWEDSLSSGYHPFRSQAARERFLAHYDARAEAWPAPSDELMVETSWGATFVRLSGPKDGPPLVLLPGAGGSSLQWIPNIIGLSAERRVYSVDNIYDVGRSVYTRRPMNARDFVDWLDELLDELGLHGDVALMGLSYGGWITAEYALVHPERLDRIVLVAPAATVQNLSPDFIKRAVLAAIPHRYFTRNLIRWLAADAVAAGGEMAAELDKAVDDGFIGMRTFGFRQMVPPRVLSDDELGSLEVPTLFLVGENEKIYPAATATERLRRVAPDIEVGVIPGAGHGVTLVKASEVNQLVLDYLARGADNQPVAQVASSATESYETGEEVE